MERQIFLDILGEADFKPKEAKTLYYIFNKGKCKAVEIERNMHMRQPVVSKSTNKLLDKKLITKKNAPREGKGRPYLQFELNGTRKEILNQIKQKLKSKRNFYQKLIEKANNIESEL